MLLGQAPRYHIEALAHRPRPLYPRLLGHAQSGRRWRLETTNVVTLIEPAASWAALENTMSWKLVKRPEIVAQKKGWMCWAAALESWLQATPGRMAWNQDFICERYKQVAKGMEVLSPQGAALPATFTQELLLDSVLNLRMDHTDWNSAKDMVQDGLYRLLR